jgi:hypothetical protein
MKMLVRPGDTVTVTDGAAGRQMTGRLAELSSTKVVLLVDGAPRELTVDDVAAVHQRRSGSLAKGAKIGAIVGGALGLAAALEFATGCERNCDGVAPFVATMVFAESAFGAGIGVGVSAMTRHNALVYAHPSSAARVTVSPFATASRRGVGVTLGF